MKQPTVSATQIRKTLNDCKFNPRKPGPLKIVADLDHPNYWMLRAVENIQLIQVLPAEEHSRIDPLLKQSIQLLALTKAYLEAV